MSAAAVAERSAIAKIEQRGILLVFPIENRPEPRSLWSELHPRSKMKWEWDQDGDTRVHDLWHLRARLMRSRKVVYAKWYRGRATFFSHDVYRALLAALHDEGDPRRGLSREAQAILELLEEDSPLSTKELRRRSDLQGRFLAATYERAMKELWSRLLIVGAGEVDDGAFPSLAVGATRLLFEELWTEARSLGAEGAALLKKTLADAPLLAKEVDKTLRLGSSP